MRDRTAKTSPRWWPSGTRHPEAAGRTSGALASREAEWPHPESHTTRICRWLQGSRRTRCPFLELPPRMAAIGSETGARLPSRVRRDEPDPVEASQRGRGLLSHHSSLPLPGRLGRLSSPKLRGGEQRLQS